jgi:hypothetical protein
LLGRPPRRDPIFYADGVTEPRDPLFIVPAVQPDEEPTPSAPANKTPAAPAPVREPLIRRRVRRVRRTTRTVRYIDPWSVLRVSALFHLVLYLILLITGVLLWNVANTTGTVDNVERFMESFGWETFEFDGGEIFSQAWVLGLFLAVGLTGLAVLVAVTFNLIADVVGGVRVMVLEDVLDESEAVPAPASTGIGSWLRTRRTDR